MTDVPDKTPTPGHLNQWLYFGCWRESGHHLYSQRGLPVTFGPYQGLLKLDGQLAPVEPAPYVAALSYLGRWQCTALSWWDHTVDKRSGSNSIIFAPGVLPVRAVLREGRERFPLVFERLPQKLILEDGDERRPGDDGRAM